MKIKPTTVKEYIDAFPEEIQQRLDQIRNIFKKTIPGVVGKEHLYISAYKKHIGMYPIYGLEELENELIEYRGKNTKDALHFPHVRPIPIALIEKIIKQKSPQ